MSSATKDPHHAGAWYNLGLRGGGLVAGLGYSTPEQCYAKAGKGRDRKLEVDLASLPDSVTRWQFGKLYNFPYGF